MLLSSRRLVFDAQQFGIQLTILSDYAEYPSKVGPGIERRKIITIDV